MIPYIYDEPITAAPSKTFYLDFDRFILTNEVIDEEQAVRQAIQIICAVRRNTPGFPDGFGLDLDSVLGVSRAFTKANIERLLKDAILFDDRIDSLDDFQISDCGEHDILVEFTVNLLSGNSFSEEVILNGV